MHFAMTMKEGFLAVSVSVSHVQRRQLVPGVLGGVTPLGLLALPEAAGFGWCSFMNKNLSLWTWYFHVLDENF